MHFFFHKTKNCSLHTILIFYPKIFNWVLTVWASFLPPLKLALQTLPRDVPDSKGRSRPALKNLKVMAPKRGGKPRHNLNMHGFSSTSKYHSPPGPALDGPENCAFIHPMTLCIILHIGCPGLRMTHLEFPFYFLNPRLPSPNQEASAQPQLIYNKTYKSSHFFAEKRPSHSSPENRPVLEELQLWPF